MATGEIAMFELSEVVPSWRGMRIAALREPMRLGIAALATKLAGCTAALVITVDQFDYDSNWDRIEAIVPLGDAALAPAHAAELIKQHEKRLCLEHPEWQVLTREPQAVNVMPATGAIVPGNFPRQVIGAKLGNAEMYESAYIRATLVEADGPTELIADVLNLSGRQDALIAYLKGLATASAAP